MLPQTHITIEQKYLVSLQYVVNHFSVFDTVFEQYFETYQNICQGKCLVDENLPILQRNFSGNVIKFEHLVTNIATIEAPIDYEYVQHALTTISNNYLSIVKQVTHLLSKSSSQNDSNISAIFLKLKKQRQNLNDLLANIKPLTN